MQSKILIVFILGLIAGCASGPVQMVDTANAARIRVFHGTAVYIHPGMNCFGSNSPETIHAAAGGFSMLVGNKKIGMPVTEDMPWSYHEYYIPAGKPLTLEMSWSTDGGGLRQSCGPVGASFIPEVGKNYDTAMLIESGRCSIKLRELSEISPGKATASIKASVPAFACRNG